MSFLEPTESYSELERILLRGMDNSDRLTETEKEKIPLQYKFGKSDYQNIHEIKLNDDIKKWDNSAWHILKPRFFDAIMLPYRRERLNTIIQELLGLTTPIKITDEILQRILIEGTQNNRIFDAFLMMKRLEERLFQADPSRTDSAQKYSAKKIHTDLKTEEKELIGSLWPMVKDPSQWQKNPNPSFDDISSVLDILKQIIAKIAIHSTLEAIALEYWRQDKKANPHFFSGNLPEPSSLGLCNLEQTDFNKLIEVLISLPQTPKIATWLNGMMPRFPITETLSKLLNAALKKPANLTDFLGALNLEKSSAKAKLDEINEEEKKRSTEYTAAIESFEQNKVLLNARVSHALGEIKGFGNQAEYTALMEAYQMLQGNLSPSSPHTEIKQQINLFRDACAKHFKAVDKIMGHGWLHRFIEATIKAVLALFVGIAMVLGTFFNQGLAKKEHRDAYKNTFFTWDVSDTCKTIRKVERTLLGDNKENKGLLDETIFKGPS